MFIHKKAMLFYNNFSVIQISVRCTYVLGADRISYAYPSFSYAIFNYFNINIPVSNSNFSVVDPE